MPATSSRRPPSLRGTITHARQPEVRDTGRKARPRSGGEASPKDDRRQIDLVYERGYPVTVNHAAQTEFATRVASEVAATSSAVGDTPPMMGAEDFAYMLEARPGAFIFLRQRHSAGLHHPAYNFNDEAIVYGTSYWIKLVENSLAA